VAVDALALATGASLALAGLAGGGDDCVGTIGGASPSSVCFLFAAPTLAGATLAGFAALAGGMLAGLTRLASGVAVALGAAAGGAL
jgi:hypothetical protein